jgi:hypothetical protein
MAPAGARFRVWLRFLAISDLVAVDWLRPVGSTPLESFIKPIRNRAESVELHPTPRLFVPPSHASRDSGSQADPATLKSADTEVIPKAHGNERRSITCERPPA